MLIRILIISIARRIIVQNIICLGHNECVEMVCEHYCLIVDNVPICYCDDGYTSQGTSCIGKIFNRLYST